MIMSKITTSGDTITSKEILTQDILELVKGQLVIIKKELQVLDSDLLLLLFFQKTYKMTENVFVESFFFKKLIK